MSPRSLSELTSFSSGRYAIFFPAIGAALGWLGARCFMLLDPWLGATMSALLVLALWTLLTGARQETGIIALHGPVGIVAVIFLTALRWQALIRLPSAPVAELTATLAASRSALVAIAWLSRPSGDEPRLATHLTTTTAVAVMLQGLIIGFLPGVRAGLLMLSASSFMVWLAWTWFDRQGNGVNSHALHASTLLIETLILVVISCRNCI